LRCGAPAPDFSHHDSRPLTRQQPCGQIIVLQYKMKHN
jgi:hypothetical protein